ncbi:MAG: squalene--hopene cyclase [Phycisphaerales bacterium]|nr:MAG: squalene--hopene cyclase [Phycisphaerales bacterium]
MPETPSTTDLHRYRGVLDRALDALQSLQREDGHFCGELEGDSILQSEYLLMKFILGHERQPMTDGSDGWETLGKIARYLRSQQRADGGWGQYPGSGIDLSATVKAYFALKLMGDSPQAEHMQKARDVIVALGGAENCNSFTNFYLACLGQISFNAVPAIPPEIVFLPRWFYFHLSKVSAWTRTMILPLSLVVTLRPMRKLPPELGIDELYVDRKLRHRLVNRTGAPKAWAAFFLTIDRLLKLAHKLGGTPIRRMAIRQAEQWILDRAGQDGDSATAGLGAIFPPMVYLQIAFHALGYERDHPVIRRAERELVEFFIEEDGAIRIQPCFSPVWDTGIALYALADCGFTIDQEPAAAAAAWLRTKECRHIGDWKDNLRGPARVGGWFFEYHNAWYPDVDDTAMVAMALKRTGGAENDAAARRGVEWMLAMQNDDGGWAAFDRTSHRQILEYIPFADHNAMQDPSCPDITGRVLECLSWHGYTIDREPVRKAVEYIKSCQEQEGCFFGRWGVNYIYGTWQAVIGPIRCGVSRDEKWIQKAGEWVKSIQKEDGSFGESANSYEDPSLKGRGNSTASQTAWAAMILQEVFGPDDPDLARAIEWLASTQLDEADASDPVRNPDGDPAGSWSETEFTGTGFPRVFYLRYHLYRLYLPIMAIGRYLAAQEHEVTAETSIEQVQLST